MTPVASESEPALSGANSPNPGGTDQTPPREASLIDNFLTHFVPLWPGLHSLSESKLVKSSYVWLVVVPVVAKLLHAMDYKVVLFGNVIPLSLPFSPKIFYFAAVAFALANIVYNVFCPHALKVYRNFKDFQDAGRSADVLMAGFVKLLTSRVFLWPLAFDRHAKKVFLTEYTDFTGRSEDLNPKNIEAIDSLYSTPISRDKLPNAFGFVQWNFSRALPCARLLCSALYLIGFILVFRLAYENFLYVWESVP